MNETLKERPTYPPDSLLEEIKNDPATDFHALMAKIKPHWEFGSWGWRQDGDIYYLSTGGWSGNEDIIQALMENTMFHLMYWLESTRGGHYVFAPMKMDVIDKLRSIGRQVSETSEVPLAYKALCVIEYLSYRVIPDEKVNSNIYKFSHIALGRCKADHTDWIAELETLYAEIKARG